MVMSPLRIIIDLIASASGLWIDYNIIVKFHENTAHFGGVGIAVM